MASRLLFSGLSLLALIGAGCHSAPKAGALPECKVPPTEVETIKVQVPPQKITIEQPTETLPPVNIAPKQPESAPVAPSRPESSARTPRLEASGTEADAGAVTGGGLGRVSGFTRTQAMTRSLGTVNGGGFSLGLGLQWIHIPIPLPRFFSVEETPSITVPLTEANLVQAGGVGVRGSGESFSREELAAAVALELAAARTKAKQQESAAAPPANDAERKALEKKLADAEAQIEKMNSMLKSIEDKLPPRK